MATYTISLADKDNIKRAVIVCLDRYMDYQANICPLDWEDLQTQIIPDPSARAWCDNGFKVAPDMVPQRKDFIFRVPNTHECERQLAFKVNSAVSWCVAHLYEGYWFDTNNWSPTSRNAITIKWQLLNDEKAEAFAQWVNHMVETGRHHAFVKDTVNQVLDIAGDKTTSLFYHWEFLTQFIDDSTLKKRMHQLPHRVLARYKPSDEFERTLAPRIKIAEPIILRGKMLQKWERPTETPLTFDYFKHKTLAADKF